MVCLTLSENCSNVSFLMLLPTVCLFKYFATILKKFLIGFKSGDLAGILKIIPPTFVIAFLAFAEFCLGQPSVKNQCV